MGGNNRSRHDTAARRNLFFPLCSFLKQASLYHHRCGIAFGFFPDHDILIIFEYTPDTLSPQKLFGLDLLSSGPALYSFLPLFIFFSLRWCSVLLDCVEVLLVSTDPVQLGKVVVALAAGPSLAGRPRDRPNRLLLRCAHSPHTFTRSHSAACQPWLGLNARLTDTRVSSRQTIDNTRQTGRPQSILPPTPKAHPANRLITSGFEPLPTPQLIPEPNHILLPAFLVHTREQPTPLAHCPSASATMDQWQGYSDAAAGSQRRYNGTSQRDYPRQNSQHQQSPGPLRYDQYGNVSQSSATSPMSTPQLRDNNGDVAMSDAHDAYGAMKYPMRPHHQTHLSGSARPSAMALHSAEPSAAAQRYSPMEVLSPTSPYPPKPASGQFSPHRQSPTRANSDYSSSPYYPSRQSSQLPTLASYGNNGQDSQPGSAAPYDGANDLKPRRTQEKKPVPEFKKLRAVSDLRPVVNAQPPFRRANPEGGFISVSYPAADLTWPRLTHAFMTVAFESSHDAAPRNLSNLQPELQIRIFSKPPPSTYQA